jgi:hypothetical protein
MKECKSPRSLSCLPSTAVSETAVAEISFCLTAKAFCAKIDAHKGTP